MTNSGTAIVDQSANDTQLTLGAGDTLVVRLPVQMGTGHVWQEARRDSAHLALVDEEILDEAAPARLGGTQVQRFRYRVLGPGASQIELHYLQPWEKGAAPAQVYRLYIQAGTKDRGGR